MILGSCLKTFQNISSEVTTLCLLYQCVNCQKNSKTFLKRLLYFMSSRENFQPLAGKFSGHTRQKPKRDERSRTICTLLVGQRNSDQSEPWKSDLKIICPQYHNSMAKSTLLIDVKLYKWLVMVIFPWGNCALLWQWIITLEGVGTPRKKWPVCLGFAWLTLKSREWSSVPGWNQLFIWWFCDMKYLYLLHVYR